MWGSSGHFSLALLSDDYDVTHILMSRLWTPVTSIHSQVVDLREVRHLKHLPLLHSLNLSRNPVEVRAQWCAVVLCYLSAGVIVVVACSYRD